MKRHRPGNDFEIDMNRSHATGPSMSGRSSLFGNQDEQAKRDEERQRMYQQQTEDMLERGNDQQLDHLSSRVTSLRDITQGISIEIERSTKQLDELEQGFSNTRSLLGGTMDRLKDLTQTASSKHMCYLVLFAVGVFVLLYFILTHTSTSGNTTNINLAPSTIVNNNHASGALNEEA
eukprot:TRINITY_DN4183_c0_g1_i1.p1 TRINITY_DN4183_c0_g1~~TRINITY_DN4183_c0_g1_i1.p1  ORF type:complete len:177 (-),score=42.60 TRINITY_DN4183_c0_g1_i1:259-789(-)